MLWNSMKTILKTQQTTRYVQWVAHFAKQTLSRSLKATCSQTHIVGSVLCPKLKWKHTTENCIIHFNRIIHTENDGVLCHMIMQNMTNFLQNMKNFTQHKTTKMSKPSTDQHSSRSKEKKTELGSGTTVLRYWIINLGRKYFVEDQNGVRANFNHKPVYDSFYITSVVPKMRTIFNTIVLKHLYLAEVTSIFVL